MLYIIVTWNYFPSTGTGWLHTTTGSFHSSGRGTYYLRRLLGTCVLVQHLGSSTKKLQQCPEDRRAGPGKAVAPSEYVALGGGGGAPLCWDRSVAGWLRCHPCTQYWGAMRGNLLPSAQILLPQRKKNSPEPHTLPSFTGNSAPS